MSEPDAGVHARAIAGRRVARGSAATRTRARVTHKPKLHTFPHTVGVRGEAFEKFEKDARGCRHTVASLSRAMVSSAADACVALASELARASERKKDRGTSGKGRDVGVILEVRRWRDAREESGARRARDGARRAWEG